MSVHLREWYPRCHILVAAGRVCEMGGSTRGARLACTVITGVQAVAPLLEEE